MKYFEYYELSLRYPDTSILSKGQKTLACRLFVSYTAKDKEKEKQCLDEVKMFIRIYAMLNALATLHNFQPFTVENKKYVCDMKDNNIGCDIKKAMCYACEPDNEDKIYLQTELLDKYYMRFDTIILLDGTERIPLDIVCAGVEGQIELYVEYGLLSKNSEIDLYTMVARPYYNTMLDRFGPIDGWLKHIKRDTLDDKHKKSTRYDLKLLVLLNAIDTLDIGDELAIIDKKIHKDTSKLN